MSTFAILRVEDDVSGTYEQGSDQRSFFGRIFNCVKLTDSGDRDDAQIQGLMSWFTEEGVIDAREEGADYENWLPVSNEELA